MEYIKIRFGDDSDRLESRFEKNIEDMFRSISPMFSLSEKTWKPQVDIYETEKKIMILAEIAGVCQKDLEIEINSKAVRIFGKRYELPRGERAKYRLAEIQFGNFERILFLPVMIDPENVTASYDNGFLKIHLTKKPVEKTFRIPIVEG
jgi:HSP20 family protein